MLTDDQVERMAEAACDACWRILENERSVDKWRNIVRAAWDARPMPEDLPSAEELAEWIGCDMTYARGALHHLSPWLQTRTEDPRIAAIREEVKPIPIADLVEHGTDAPQLLAQRIRRIRELLEG